jgi:hypothetical protein
MSNIFTFNYNIFFRYYDPANIYNRNIFTQNGTLPKVHFLNSDREEKHENVSNKYIEITLADGKHIKLYISVIKKNNLLFSIPKLHSDGKIWDFHYHFGLDKNTIFLHTKYIDVRKNCYFLNKSGIPVDVEDFKQIKCTNDRHYMGKFSEEDISIIYELIKLPFRSSISNTVTGGKRRKKITTQNKRPNKLNRTMRIKFCKSRSGAT